MQRQGFTDATRNYDLLIELDVPRVRVVCKRCDEAFATLATSMADAEHAARFFAGRHLCSQKVKVSALAFIDATTPILCSDCGERECQCLMPHGEWPAEARAAYIAEFQASPGWRVPPTAHLQRAAAAELGQLIQQHAQQQLSDQQRPLFFFEPV